ncbi:hypothetical protein E0F15_16160 [Frankia sp. B2]|nr:hypothetical protein KBI5_12520 [Frankia sp. KB5]TFE27601.1 hypothetical protein E0F15_16160 [Frankia sp. B2]
MALRKSPKYFLMVVIVALGTILSAAPSMASPPRSAPGAVHRSDVHCYWRHMSGHWVWRHGHRTWIPPRTVRVCR